MDNLSLAKGTTSVGGLLGASTGVYYGANSEFNEILKNWNNGKGWLLYEGRELVGVGEGSVNQWNKVVNRYKSYINFNTEEKGKKSLEITELSDPVDAKKIQEWCEKKFKSRGGDRDYGKVRKWCTKHATMEDKLKSDGMMLDLTKQTKNDYESLLSALSVNTEDKAFLENIEKVPPNDDSKKVEKAKSWCQQKANIDFSDGEEHYSTFKKFCGKNNRGR